MIITVPAHTSHDLNWTTIENEAKNLEGTPIVWKLDLGLFNQLPNPPLHQAQYQTLAFNLQHFDKTLFQKYGGEKVILYQGGADWTSMLKHPQEEQDFKQWAEEKQLDPASPQVQRLYARHVGTALLENLLVHIDSELPVELHFEMEPHLTTSHFLQLTAHDQFENFTIITPLINDPTAQQAILLPPNELLNPEKWNHLGPFADQLKDKGISHRLITETNLHLEWHELETLHYSPQALTVQGKRKVDGFIAAGGHINPIE